MDNIVVMTTATAALVFSVAMALLIEELVFGGIFRLFFGERPPLNNVVEIRKPGADVVARARRSGL
jgi:hypothetical protein